MLLSSGPVSVSCGFVLALRFPGKLGDTLLVAAAASAVLGELISTFALKNMLTQLGELTLPAVAVPVVAQPAAVPEPRSSERSVVAAAARTEEPS